MLFANGTFVGVLKGKCSFGCMHPAFARCLEMVQKSFGLTFTHVSGAPEALASYFKWFGGQPAGKEPSSLTICFADRPLVRTIEGGLKS